MRVFVLLLSFASAALAVTTCSVLDYGAAADNSTDLGPALTKAYSDCVEGAVTTSAADTVLLVPSGNFLLASNVAFTSAKYFTLTITGNIYLPFDADLTGNMLLWDVSGFEMMYV